MTYFDEKLENIKILPKEDYPQKGPRPSKIREDLPALITELGIKDGDSLSFHHHLRNGDKFLVQVMKAVQSAGIKDITCRSFKSSISNFQ